MGFKERIFVASAYLFGIPALYIVLTQSRRKQYIGYHGAQAFVLWVLFFVLFFALRYFINLIWSVRYIPQLEKLEIVLVVVMGCYAIFCAYRSFIGEDNDERKIFTNRKRV